MRRPHPALPEHPREDDSLSLAEQFHENTKMRRRVNKTYSTRIGTVLDNPKRFEFMTRAYRRYPNRPRHELPRPEAPGGPPLEEAMLRRRSRREFGKEPIEAAQLSRLLYYSYAVTDGKPFDRSGLEQPLRPVPSGGALFPLEVYAVVLGARDLPCGVHHYDVVDHCLELLEPCEDAEALRARIPVSDNVGGFSVLLVLSAVFERMLFKYGDRGYRFVMLDAGHLAQNLCLAAAGAGLGAVCMGGFYDDEVNALVGADGVNEAVVYTVAVGAPIS